jgi:hypothetical protein
MRISPISNKLSVVTGLRLYVANNLAGADPVQYRVEGRETISGTNLQTRHSNKCLVVTSVSDGYRITVASSCASEQSDQQFYMNELGEIRVKSLPGYCMDPRYGLSPAYDANYMIPCNSQAYGPDSQQAKWHKFTYDPTTERIESVFYPGNCAQFRTRNGYVALAPCRDENKQQFYSDGSFENAAGQGWTLIQDGNLPWVSDFDRNAVGTGIAIGSTYESGDTTKYYSEVKFYENTTPYFEYKVLFPGLRDPESLTLQFAEMELPGLVLN